MVERKVDISTVFAELVAKRRKEGLLKEMSGFRASKDATAFREAIETSLVEAALDESLPEDKRRQIWDLLTEGLRRKPSQAYIEDGFRFIFNLPIPSVARDETFIADEEKRRLIETVAMTRQLVLEHGKQGVPDPDGTEDPTLYLEVPKGEKGTSYCGMATPDEDDTFFRVLVSDPTPEIDLVVCGIHRTGNEFEFDLLIELVDRQTGDYSTSLMPVEEMASNEYKIIRHSLDTFLDKSGLIPPQDNQGTIGASLE